MSCSRPPRGWYCTRCPRHDGPCAARPWFWNLRELVRRLTRTG